MKILKILLSGFAQSSVTVLPCIGYLLLFPNFLVTDSLSYLHMRFVSGLLTLQNWRGVGPPLPPTLFVILGVNKGVFAKSCFRVIKFLIWPFVNIKIPDQKEFGTPPTSPALCAISTYVDGGPSEVSHMHRHGIEDPQRCQRISMNYWEYQKLVSSWLKTKIPISSEILG